MTYYDEIRQYDSVPRSYHQESLVVSRKVNEILQLVRGIDQRLKNDFGPPCVPPKEEKESFIRSCGLPGGESIASTDSCIPYNQPPPIPIKAQSSYVKMEPQKPPPLVVPEVKPDGTILLTPAHCSQLLNSLNKVKDFLDTEIDDDFEEKGINMDLLFRVTETLRVRPNKHLRKKTRK